MTIILVLPWIEGYRLDHSLQIIIIIQAKIRYDMQNATKYEII